MSVIRGGAHSALTAAQWLTRPTVRIEVFDEFGSIPPHSEADIGLRFVLVDDPDVSPYDSGDARASAQANMQAFAEDLDLPHLVYHLRYGFPSSEPELRGLFRFLLTNGDQTIHVLMPACARPYVRRGDGLGTTVGIALERHAWPAAVVLARQALGGAG